MDTIIDLQRKTISKHFRAENAKDWDSVYETFVQDKNAYCDHVPMCTRLPGIEGVKEFQNSINTAFPDFTTLITGAYDTPGSSVRELTFVGTHLGDYGGIPASGNSIELEVAVFFIFDTKANAGKILGKRVYFDNETALRQIRGETSLPNKIGLADMFAKAKLE